MSYRVVAGFVSVETKINDKGSRAVIDIPRGESLPADVPAEQLETLLRLGHVEEVKQRAKPKADK